MKEFLLSEPLTGEFFMYLGNFGRVEKRSNLGEGFYSFERDDWFSIKGFSGDTLVEVRFKPESMEMTSGFLYFLFSSYRESGTDLTVLKQREKSLSERVRVHLYRK